jgi:alpha-1,6-mannosyltransferase
VATAVATASSQRLSRDRTFAGVVTILGLAASVTVALTGAPANGRPRLATAGSAAMVACWLALLVVVHSGALGRLGVAVVAAVWAIPIAVATPLLSFDVYSYLAYGKLMATGHDPYADGPAALGPGSSWAGHVDPQVLHLKAPYGPAGLLVGRLGALTGSPEGGVVLLTVIAAASIVGIAVIIDRMCQPEDRTVALALWLTSPMVLLHLLGGVHLDDLMALLVALACLSAQHRRWVLAAVAIGVCTAVKVPAAAALPAVVLVDLPSAHGPAVRSVVVRSLGAAAGYLVPAAAVGDPSGLLRTVTSPTGNHTLAAPSVLVGKLLGGSHLANAATATVGVLAAIALILWLVRTADRRPAPVTIGGSLLAIVIGAPVVYPWYLAWGLPGLVIRPRRWLPTLITAGSLIYLPGLSGLSALAVVLVVVVAAALVAASWRIGETLAH